MFRSHVFRFNLTEIISSHLIGKRCSSLSLSMCVWCFQLCIYDPYMYIWRVYIWMFVYSILLPLALHVRYYSLHEYKPKTTRGNLWVLRYLHQVWAASIAATASAADNSALEILHMLSILWPNTFGQKANANAKSNWMRQSLRSFTFGSVRHLNKKDHTHLAGAALK